MWLVSGLGLVCRAISPDQHPGGLKRRHEDTSVDEWPHFCQMKPTPTRLGEAQELPMVHYPLVDTMANAQPRFQEVTDGEEEPNRRAA